MQNVAWIPMFMVNTHATAIVATKEHRVIKVRLYRDHIYSVLAIIRTPDK